MFLSHLILTYFHVYNLYSDIYMLYYEILLTFEVFFLSITPNLYLHNCEIIFEFGLLDCFNSMGGSVDRHPIYLNDIGYVNSQ